MITEKQKESVMELCRYVENFCKENGLSAFMSVAASEEHPDGLEQVAGSIVTGKGDKRVCMLLSMALMQAQVKKADINVIPSWGDLNMN